MSLDTIQQKILQPFIDETLANLKVMAGMGGHADEGFTDDVTKFRFKGYAICAETEGSIDGVMLMHHYIETAVAMGNSVRKHVLGEDETFDDINDQMADALAEWGNTVIGRATKALGAEELNLKFEPPYFVFDTDTMASLLTGVTDIITVPVHVDEVGRFYFNFLIRSINAELVEAENKEPVPICDSKDDASCVVVSAKEFSGLRPDQKIMIVDDMKMVRSSLKKYLKKIGYENIIEATNGKEAVEKHLSEQPDFIFMDMVMPEMTGNVALAEIRKSCTDIPIVMLTSVADEGVVSECNSLGISGYIIKPLTMETGPDVLARFLR